MIRRLGGIDLPQGARLRGGLDGRGVASVARMALDGSTIVFHGPALDRVEIASDERSGWFAPSTVQALLDLDRTADHATLEWQPDATSPVRVWRATFDREQGPAVSFQELFHGSGWCTGVIRLILT